MSKFIRNVKTRKTNLDSESSKLTHYLRTWQTVPKYYRGQLERIKNNSKNALQSIKRTETDEWRLKVQMGKYAHGLIEVDGDIYTSATFTTKEEAIKEYENWIEDLELQTQEIVQVVKPVWKEYCKANKILIKESDCEIK